jgi:protein TonB
MAGDYPISAIRRGEQGVVDMILNVDQDGRVTDCRVATSSGYDDLDAASCKIARRARYDPARDAQGKRVQAHLSTQTVWILPDRGTPAPHGVP